MTQPGMSCCRTSKFWKYGPLLELKNLPAARKARPNERQPSVTSKSTMAPGHASQMRSTMRAM